jgi:hypothetical protein
MQAFSVSGNRALTLMGESGLTVQAGTPMTVTGNGTLLRAPGQGASIFCLKISRVRSLVRHWFKHQRTRGQRPGADAAERGKA